MGIGNTTAATAVICALLGTPPSELVGPGAGADDETMARKAQAIADALGRRSPDDHPLETLAAVGGLEIAAMAGTIVEASSRQVPVIVDGVIADAALLSADRLAPGIATAVVAGHRSTEPAATKALAALGLDPLLDLSMRLGEGTGAVLAVPLLEAARRLLTDVATLDEVTGGTT
jgi:nicotinate-nucleotide--dimethylbenzimidazole phosphoribosyltransferase